MNAQDVAKGWAPQALRTREGSGAVSKGSCGIDYDFTLAAKPISLSLLHLLISKLKKASKKGGGGGGEGWGRFIRNSRPRDRLTKYGGAAYLVS